MSYTAIWELQIFTESDGRWSYWATIEGTKQANLRAERLRRVGFLVRMVLVDEVRL